jgi:hypothetical protein
MNAQLTDFADSQCEKPRPLSFKEAMSFANPDIELRCPRPAWLPHYLATKTNVKQGSSISPAPTDVSSRSLCDCRDVEIMMLLRQTHGLKTLNLVISGF